MNKKSVSRLNYFSGQSLLTDDFKTEQNYFLNLLRFNNASLRTYGIACGLEVNWQESKNQITISAGMAIDQLGREIIQVTEEIIKLPTDLAAGAYFLTINYHEVYDDLTDYNGVKGYNLIVQQPQFQYSTVPGVSGIYILLGVINIGANQQINSVTAKDGHYQREYVGSVLGSVKFVTDGTGINEQTNSPGTSTDVMSDTVSGLAQPGFTSIEAKKETNQTGDYLCFGAPRSEFTGALNTLGNIGIGESQPTANLQITAIQFTGQGKISSTAQNVTYEGEMSPFLQVGDQITPVIAADQPAETSREVIQIISGVSGGQAAFRINRAFDQDLNSVDFTYQRGSLIQVSTNQLGDLFTIDTDGSIGMGGNPANSTNVGQYQSSLNVTSDGNVVANGIVKAASFEGNGSKLQNLPILSYWVKESPGTQASKLHYVDGNVGIMTRDPKASLSVGGGISAVGSGIISVSPDSSENGDDDITITGYQTLFTQQVSPSNLITIGKIIPQPVKILSVTSDTQLTLEQQVPFVVNNSTYEILAAGGSESDAQSGAGTISSNGSVITGDGTSFTKLNQGDSLIVQSFEPDANAQSLHVLKVENDTKLLLTPTGAGSSAFQPNGSAYMITAAKLAQYQAGEDFSVLSSQAATDTGADVGAEDGGAEDSGAADTLPPAMTILTNGIEKKVAPNTVAINVADSDILSKYALQVNGEVSISGGGGSFDTITTRDLTVTQQATFYSDGTEDNLFVVSAEESSTPLLNITKSNVQIGQKSNATDYTLDVAGTLHTTEDITTDGGLTATTNISTSAEVSAATGSITGQLKTKQLEVSAQLQASAAAVLMMNRDPGTMGSFSYPSSKANTVYTDGFLIATIYFNGSVPGGVNYSFLSATTSLGSTTTSSMSATSLNVNEKTDSGKGGHDKNFYFSTTGSITMPVKSGETWQLSISNGMSGIYCTYQFVSLGTSNQNNANLAAMSIAPDSPVMFAEAPVAAESNEMAAAAPATPASEGNASDKASEQGSDNGKKAATATAVNHAQQLLEAIKNQNTPGVTISSQPSQASIDKRMSNLTDALAKTTHMTDDQADKNKFIQELSKIVCTIDKDSGKLNNDVNQQDVAKVAETFAQLSGRTLTPQEKQILIKGIDALIAINANSENRNDPAVINKNIGTFLDALQDSMGITLSKDDKRRLKAALGSIVGDGSQGTTRNALSHIAAPAPAAAAAPTPAPAAAAAPAPAPATDNTQSTGNKLEQALKSVESKVGQSLTSAAKQAIVKAISGDAGKSDNNGSQADSGAAGTPSGKVHEVLKDIESAAGKSLSDAAKQAIAKIIPGLGSSDSSDNKSNVVQQIIQNAESSIGKSLSGDARQVIHQVVDTVTNRSSDHENAGKQILKTIEDDAGKALEDGARAALANGVKNLLLGLLS